MVNGKLIQGKRLEIKRLRRGTESTASCDVLFISTSEKDRLPALLAHLRGKHILTVSGIEDFLEHGGMIEFKIRKGAVRFDVNLAAAEQEGLRLSSQLLKVASNVMGGDDSK